MDIMMEMMMGLVQLNMKNVFDAKTPKALFIIHKNMLGKAANNFPTFPVKVSQRKKFFC